MPSADVPGFSARLELLPRVLADRLQHRESRPVDRVLGSEEALVGERRADGQYVGLDFARHGAYRVNSLERAAADEHGQAAEEATLRLAQELMAPGERVPERPLPSRRVARPAREEREAGLQVGQQRPGGQQADPSHGELDREGHSV